MLPRRIPKEPKRSTRWRSLAHCSFVRSHECSVPDCTARPIEVAHVRTGTGAGIAQKPHDYFTISLCREHHAEQHRIGERSFETLHGIDMKELAYEFAKASPRAAQIAQDRRERADG